MDTKEKGERLILTSEDYIRPLCGCDVVKNGTIKYCPNHSACDDMRKALEEINKNPRALDEVLGAYIAGLVRKALAKGK